MERYGFDDVFTYFSSGEPVAMVLYSRPPRLSAAGAHEAERGSHLASWSSPAAAYNGPVF